MPSCNVFMQMLESSADRGNANNQVQCRMYDIFHIALGRMHAQGRAGSFDRASSLGLGAGGIGWDGSRRAPAVRVGGSKTSAPPVGAFEPPPLDPKLRGVSPPPGAGIELIRAVNGTCNTQAASCGGPADPAVPVQAARNAGRCSHAGAVSHHDIELLHLPAPPTSLQHGGEVCHTAAPLPWGGVSAGGSGGRGAVAEEIEEVGAQGGAMQGPAAARGEAAGCAGGADGGQGLATSAEAISRARAAAAWGRVRAAVERGDVARLLRSRRYSVVTATISRLFPRDFDRAIPVNCCGKRVVRGGNAWLTTLNTCVRWECML
jgi:hypothetical protein